MACQIGGLVMALGVWVMWRPWKQIHAAQGTLVTDGMYARMRHPQYSGLFLVTIGMLIQWPTVLTLLMRPLLTLRTAVSRCGRNGRCSHGSASSTGLTVTGCPRSCRATAGGACWSSEPERILLRGCPPRDRGRRRQPLLLGSPTMTKPRSTPIPLPVPGAR